MTPIIEAARLVLVPLEVADASQVQILFPHWDVVKYLASRVPWPYPADGAETFYRDVCLPAIARGEEWHWTLRLRNEPETIIGGISLMTTGGDNRGFWLALPWHGQGLMTEACNVVTDFWFETLKFPVLRVSKATANVASRRVSEKQGMRIVGTEEREYVSGPLPAEIWEITAEEWRTRKSRA
jgi:[ribosomal protein S5]-alanine N-acetyltransferase